MCSWGCRSPPEAPVACQTGCWLLACHSWQRAWPDACRANAQARTFTVRMVCTRLRGTSARVPSRCSRPTPRTATTTWRCGALFSLPVTVAPDAYSMHVREAAMPSGYRACPWLIGVRVDSCFPGATAGIKPRVLTNEKLWRFLPASKGSKCLSVCLAAVPAAQLVCPCV